MRVIKFTFLLLLSIQLQAQSVLDEKVTLQFKNLRFDQSLDLISDLTGVDYAFNPTLLAADFRFTATYADTALVYVLHDLCEASQLRFRLMDGTLFFYPQKKPTKKPQQIALKGRVNTGETSPKTIKIEERHLEVSTYTDTLGRYVLLLPIPEYTFDLNFSTPGYESKDFRVKANSDQQVSVSLNQDSLDLRLASDFDTVTSGVDTIHVPEITDYLPSRILVQRSLVDYTKQQDFVDVQWGCISLLAGISTRMKHSGVYYNHFSLNLISSYSAGLKGVEIGTININRFDVEGLQFAVIGNANGGKTAGYQFAAVFNQSKLKFKGGQFSAIYNESSALHEGVQLSSFWNSVKGEMRGLQASPIVNYVQKDLKGVQLGGFNHVSGNVSGVQTAMLVNRSTTTKGVQVSGLLNRSDSLQGMQLGLVNSVDTLDGMQLGLINKTKKAKGLQFGLINISDTATGTRIGLVNWIKQGGFKQLDLSTDEQQSLSLTLKTGLNKLYGILGGGVVLGDTAQAKIRLGVGKLWEVGKSEIVNELFWEGNLSDEVAFRDDFVYQLLYQHGFGNIYLHIGPRLGFSMQQADDKPFSETTGHELWLQTEQQKKLALWLGASFAVGYRF